jgi:hypothetical protein
VRCTVAPVRPAAGPDVNPTERFPSDSLEFVEFVELVE